jgi:hypothetical protein
MEAPTPEELELNENNLVAPGEPTEEKEAGQIVITYKNPIFKDEETGGIILVKKILSTGQKELWKGVKEVGGEKIQTWIKKEPLALAEM